MTTFELSANTPLVGMTDPLAGFEISDDLLEQQHQTINHMLLNGVPPQMKTETELVSIGLMVRDLRQARKDLDQIKALIETVKELANDNEGAITSSESMDELLHFFDKDKPSRVHIPSDSAPVPSALTTGD